MGCCLGGLLGEECPCLGWQQKDCCPGVECLRLMGLRQLDWLELPEPELQAPLGLEQLEPLELQEQPELQALELLPPG